MICAIISIIFGLLNVWLVLRIKVDPKEVDIELQEPGASNNATIDRQMVDIAKLIQDGASTFLKEEYTYTFVFILIFAVIIFFTAEAEPMKPYTTIPFILGALTSIISGYIGM